MDNKVTLFHFIFFGSVDRPSQFPWIINSFQVNYGPSLLYSTYRLYTVLISALHSSSNNME